MRPLVLVLSLLTTSSLLAQTSQTCNLGITVTCNGSQCTSVTTNNGGSICAGVFFTGFEVAAAGGAISGFQSGLDNPECFDNSISPGSTIPFAFCFGDASLAPGASITGMATISGGATQPVLAFSGVNDTFVYAYANAVQPTCTPTVSAPSAAQSGVSYTINWTPVSNPQTQFQIDESTSADFSSNVTTTSAAGISASFVHTVTNNTTYYYRVRAINCGANPNSATVSTVVQATPQIPATAKTADVVTAFGSTQPVTAQIFIPGVAQTLMSGSAQAGVPVPQDTGFAASTDKPYLTVTPSSGTIPPGGTTVTVTANPTSLPPGANTGTVTVTSGGSTVASVPLSVSLVTPVAPGSKSLPPNNALIIPVVTHVNGATSPFFSDVRLTNASPAKVTYQLTFTPTRTDGTTSSKVTNVTVDSQQTLALNDIAKDFFGYGASGDPNDTGFGSLEIRPLNTSSLLTFAASRTYASTASGTFGQFIAAIPFSKFIGNTAPPIPTQLPTHQTLLSLQQIAQSAKFRTNLGLTEGSGSPASGQIRVFDDGGNLLKSVPYSLRAGEQQQLNSFLATNGLTLDDGRIEITVDSPTGAVAAYASVLDNLTADPLAVMPAIPSTISATRYVVPGIADLNNGAANFHSDLRIFNGGASLAHATLTYVPQGSPSATKSVTVDIDPSKVRAFDNVLPSLFNVTNSGGSVLITTDTPSSLVTTARTYSIDTKGGTFGQFIPGVSPADGIGLGDRPLQILQLEQSQHFRSNLGLAELTGNAVKVRVSLFLPDSKVTPSTEVDLAPNEFRQLSSVIAGMNPGNTYNARITVEVISGTGRVTAYGSVVDNDTQDPTYVPAQ